MKLGTLSITGNKFRLPCVYEFVRDGIVLYVGRSDNGFARAFTTGMKEHVNRIVAFRDATEIRLHVYDSIEQSREEEAKLIYLLKPKYNIQGLAGKGRTAYMRQLVRQSPGGKI
jgi:excinuclease UvrABC nuclease subunit